MTTARRAPHARRSSRSSRIARAALVVAGATLLATACSEPAPPPAAAPEPPAAATPATPPRPAPNPQRNAYFGDLHVHTKFSFDAFVFGTRASPDDAYRFARGEALTHPAGFPMQLKTPLDFQAVTDHGVYMGMVEAMADPATRAGQHPLAVAIREAKTPAERRQAFGQVIPRLRMREGDDLVDPEILASAWSETRAAAERHNDPGRFTTFIGYEYTSSGPEFQNLHRNVIFSGGSAPDVIFKAVDSPDPEDLWAWFDAIRPEHGDVLAIPHNPNGSDGWMFRDGTYEGEPLTADYAERRAYNEPILEVTQVKGNSDTHPALSPNDEWADFEIMTYRIGSNLKSSAPGSYVREAWGNGLAMQDTRGFNPFRFGVIGASDTHNAAGSFDEANYFSKTGLTDASAQLRGSVPLPDSPPDAPKYADSRSSEWGASGLAGVWAEENTREALFAAMRRKETFATTGPRIRVRFFAGALPEDIATQADPVAAGYASGVPMGGTLAPADAPPRFFVWAARDPESAGLQRVQVVKVWSADGKPAEKVFDVACAGGVAVDPATGRCPDNGATVDLATCTPSAATEAAELATAWSDPEFVPGQRALWYVRVLENPTCRWSTWDAIRAGTPPNPALHATLQERAYSSPIWYQP